MHTYLKSYNTLGGCGLALTVLSRHYREKKCHGEKTFSVLAVTFRKAVCGGQRPLAVGSNPVSLTYLKSTNYSLSASPSSSI